MDRVPSPWKMSVLLSSMRWNEIRSSNFAADAPQRQVPILNVKTLPCTLNTAILCSLGRWFWYQAFQHTSDQTPKHQTRHLTGEFRPLLISIFAHCMCKELAYSADLFKDINEWQSMTVTLPMHQTTPHSHSLMKIKSITVTIFSNPPWPCSATGRITIIQTLPSLHQHH